MMSFITFWPPFVWLDITFVFWKMIHNNVCVRQWLQITFKRMLNSLALTRITQYHPVHLGNKITDIYSTHIWKKEEELLENLSNVPWSVLLISYIGTKLAQLLHGCLPTLSFMKEHMEKAYGIDLCLWSSSANTVSFNY